MFDKVSREDYELMQTRAIEAEAEVKALTRENVSLTEQLSESRVHVKELIDSMRPIKEVQNEQSSRPLTAVERLAIEKSTPAHGKVAIMGKNARIKELEQVVAEERLTHNRAPLAEEEKAALEMLTV